MADIAKPPPSNFIWPPPGEFEKFPIAAPLYVAPPETQRITAKPCSYRPLEKPQHLSAQNLCKVESQQTNSSEYECLNVDSNITVTTTSTSNASSESEYKMYQTQNNHYANMFEQTIEVDDEVEEINQKPIIDLRKTPPLIELPKNIKRVEFVEPDPSYKAETFSSVFSNRKETWQKLTSSSYVRQEESHDEVTETIENISEEEQNKNEEHDEDDDENDVEQEIQGQHVGPLDGAYYQLAPSNIPQPTPKCYQSDFHKALITTSERPYHIGDIAPTPEPRLPNLDLYEEAVKEAQNNPVEEEKPRKSKKEVPKFEVKTTSKKCEFPYQEQDMRKGSLMSSLMRTASPKPMKFVKSNVIEEVHLPDDEDAYFPPPISMEPHEPYGTLEPYRTKSPFVGALTTVPDRPYTPFGREIMSQLSMELPQDNKKITFSNALHTVPDDSFNSSSLEYDYDPVEYTAKVYERIAVDTEAEETSSNSAFAQFGSSSTTRSFLPTIQPWSTASDQFADNSYTDSTSGHESLECHVSESRRCSEFQRRRSSVAQDGGCDSRRCSEAPKQLSDLLNRCSKVNEEDEFDPDLPNPNAIYPKRSSQPSPFEGMQMKLTNKMTSSLHKADEIPTYQRKWYNLATQNPPKTPEPEELRDNVPMAFHEWSSSSNEWNQHQTVEVRQVKVTNKLTASLHNAEEVPKWFIPTENQPDDEERKNVSHDFPTSANASRHCSVSFPDHQTTGERREPDRASFAETGMSSKPPIPAESSTIGGVLLRRSSGNDSRREENVILEEAEDDFEEIKFPTVKIIQVENVFPTKGIRKNSLFDLPERQKVQLDKQRNLQQELHQHQKKMQNKQKVRQQKELEMLNAGSSSSRKTNDEIREEIQQNQSLSAYEQEMEYKRQLELEKQQRQKERELKEQQARELEYQRQLEEYRQHEIWAHEKRERESQQQTLREIEYQKIREEQEATARHQQEERDLELRRQQEEVEKEIKLQQEHQKREAEKLEARRLWDIRRKEETERELERLETELRNKREEELRRLEKEVRDKREQRKREEKAAEQTRIQEQKLREETEREQRILEEIAAKEQKDNETKLQIELKMRQKQEADRKQREEMELFDIEEEHQRQESSVNVKRQQTQQQTSNMYSSHIYQQQMVWPPNSKPATPAPTPQPRPIPIIKTDSETELNATRFRFEPLDEDQRRFMAGIRPPSTCYSPATEDKPFPSIPYYQQHLAFYEAEPEHAGIFNPKAVSPTPNRSKSPAFGPPPNPLLAFVNKPRDPELDESGIYLCGERLLSPIWYDKQHKPIPPAVQRKIHPLGSSRPPSKPDLSAIKEAVKKHKLEAGTKPPPIPPPMPAKLPALRQKTGTEDETTEKKVTSNELPPKGIVASQIRRLSGDASNLFAIRSSITINDITPESLPTQEKDFMKVSRQNDFYDERQQTRQLTTNSFASSSITPSRQLTNYNNIQSSSQSYDQHFMGQSLASANFQNSQMNPNSVENVRVSIGSVGAPGGLPKHGRTFTTSGPNRGQGVLTQPSTGRIPICGGCSMQVRLVTGSIQSLYA